MDNLGNNDLPGNDDFGQSIPFDDGGVETPARNADAAEGGMAVSRAPLNLGGGGASPPPRPKATPPKVEVPQPKRIATQAVQATQTVQGSAPGQRITSLKTFYTKLHGGAIEFLDEQIASWLEKNPNVVVKRTNVVVGELQAKKTEPNIIILVWY